MINTEIEKKGGIESTIDTMKQEEEKTLIIPLIVTKKIETGTIQRMKGRNTIERENAIQMTGVTVCLHPMKMKMTKGSLYQEKLTR
jgi:hypothetical protein